MASDLSPGLGTSMCCKHSPKNKQKQKQNKTKRRRKKEKRMTDVEKRDRGGSILSSIANVNIIW